MGLDPGLNLLHGIRLHGSIIEHKVFVTPKTNHIGLLGAKKKGKKNVIFGSFCSVTHSNFYCRMLNVIHFITNSFNPIVLEPSLVLLILKRICCGCNDSYWLSYINFWNFGLLPISKFCYTPKSSVVVRQYSLLTMQRSCSLSFGSLSVTILASFTLLLD